MRLVSHRQWPWLRPYLTARPFQLVAIVMLGAVVVAGLRIVPRSNAEALPPEANATGKERWGLNAAFAAAFGPNDYALRRIGEGRELVRFTPGLLVDARFGPVLISEGRVLSPRASSTGKLAIAYLEPTPDGYRVRRSFVPAIEGGPLGELEGWRVSTGGRYPVIEAQCASPALLEVRPDGPRAVAPEAQARNRTPLC